MIIVENLWKSFGPQQVLEGLELQVEKGETVAILGRSGTGKSVLLRHIIGMEHPDKGRIEVDGKTISNLSPTELFNSLKGIGMLFQSGALFDSLSVKENVAFYLRQHSDLMTKKILGESELNERVKEALKMVGLENTEEKMPSELSGGMRKRVAFARLIAYRPRIILYDEPTAGLDPIIAMQISDLIMQIQKELEATSIVVTHDLPVALKIANRLALHDEGKIAYIDKVEDFFNHSHPVIQDFFDNAFPRSALKRKFKELAE